eukprot:gnl/MRDRNA2_/MRDRNA2_18272_c0_seq1.p1 gnl/MRDRNA2_/MRDRNA2_18272_c0~~gnl/MRDRNA2_/MRDRNA2_18272_c0_seq1.p1  ORF type:complete len:156 (+),score=13.81 gnl/MRDRNA2_/MRDRNA2_18272_c0_seq1:42-509(+)
MLQWGQLPRYIDNPPPRSCLLQTYANAWIVGPPGSNVQPIDSEDDILVGVFLLGPDTFYPPHFHPAPEVFSILDGSATWFKGEWPLSGSPLTSMWQKHVAGETVPIISNQHHSMLTAADETMLALWAWPALRDTSSDWCTCNLDRDFALCQELKQ